MSSERKNSKLWRIRSMFLKELNLIKNDKYALLLVFVLPGMIMGTMFVAIEQGEAGQMMGETSDESSGDALSVGVVDADPTNTYPGQDLSENFTWYLQESSRLLVTMYDTEEEALDALYRDTVDAYAVIPYGFEGNISGDIPAFVQIHISSTNFDQQSAVYTAFSQAIVSFRSDHGWIKGEVRMKNVREFEPEGNYTAATFGVFLLVFASFIATAATAAQAIVGDIPLNRMLLTPATKLEAILSKTLAYFTVGMIQAQFLLVLWIGLFGIVPNTDYLTLNAVLALMAFSGSALGVFISTLCNTRLQANQSFLLLLFSSFIVGTGFMDVGIVDEYYPLNLGRVMLFDTAFKGLPITYFTPEIIRVLIFSSAMLLLAYIVFMNRQTLA